MRIAQVTDFHLRFHLPGTSSHDNRLSRRMPEVIPQVLGRIAKQKVDFLAMTGDLIDWPHEADGEAIEKAVEDYTLIREMLDASGLPYMVMPGNHDMERAMWRVFDRRDNVRDIAGHRVIRFCDDELIRHMPHRVNDQRARFVEALTDSDSPPQVHLQHFVITPALNVGYPHTYHDGEKLAQQIARSGRVRLCLSGHYHRGTDLVDISGTRFAVGLAMCTAPHPWRIYEINGRDVTMTTHALP